MGSIKWLRPDGGFAYTSTKDPANADTADQLLALGVVSSDWLAVEFNQPIPAPDQMTPQEFSRRVAASVNSQLDELARSWRYRDYISARSYRDDPNPRFAAEASVLIAHGSACWTVLDDLEAAVVAGTAQMPDTVEDVLALLPPAPERPTV